MQRHSRSGQSRARAGKNNQTCSGIAAAGSAAQELLLSTSAALRKMSLTCATKHVANIDCALFVFDFATLFVMASECHACCGSALCSRPFRLLALRPWKLFLLKKSLLCVKPNIAVCKISPRFVPPRSLKNPFLARLESKK